MTIISIAPIGVVRSARKELRDDNWDTVAARIELAPEIGAEAWIGLDAFSHVEVIFHFDRVPEEQIEWGSRHPRNNSYWPRVGIFAQRGKNRPNRLGVSVVRLLKKEDRIITIQGLDAVDGTPVLDIKPVMKEFLPRESVSQPWWSHELMEGYWMKMKETPSPQVPLD